MSGHRRELSLPIAHLRRKLASSYNATCFFHACRITGSRQNTTQSTISRPFGLTTRFLAVAKTLHPDVPLLSPRAPPRIPDQPIHRTAVHTIPNQLYSVIHFETTPKETTFENSTIVKLPTQPTSSNRDGNGACICCRHQLVVIIYFQRYEAIIDYRRFDFGRIAGPCFCCVWIVCFS